MSSENKTPNLQLNQWKGNEYPKRTDFIEDNKRIDEAYKELKDIVQKGGKVSSVNGKIGDVILKAEDIKTSNNKTIEKNFSDIESKMATKEDLNNIKIPEVLVKNVNGKIGDVVLKAEDIKGNNNKNVEENLNKISSEIGDINKNIGNINASSLPSELRGKSLTEQTKFLYNKQPDNMPDEIIIFISANGNDNNDGKDKSRPVKSWARIQQLIPPFFDGELWINICAGGVVNFPEISGLKCKLFISNAYPDEGVIGPLNVENCVYVSLYNLTVQLSTSVYSALALSDIKEVRVRDVIIKGKSPSFGLNVSSTSGGFYLIEGCNFGTCVGAVTEFSHVSGPTMTVLENIVGSAMYGISTHVGIYLLRGNMPKGSNADISAGPLSQVYKSGKVWS
ncbi:hypothetical protein [Clostridium sp. UBA6640]|uniref:hypothetical protein n=1 Tax=Clostridium sp. UBA6640 TaxID=1946370 RepID=UPI0025B956E1|nr:hypothetical protein [Clostridium sp. UBA6640]